ncbi:hypothetical protein [Hufsiella ginkgonis]|uniref:DNA primase n=1 Tax=Hufsiella ginkgonis TaxID=2695274 RepID=A0A7K1XTP8_9SPHI|nr:hypothetical protein [Hufsiella ginkgonis]MXV14167.1 hypothetical protein [Hufsiella ginkgonis]
MNKNTLITANPDLLLYTEGKLNTAIPGGIKLTGLDRLKVTLKLTIAGQPNGPAFRHNLDLYNSIQTDQLVEKVSEALELNVYDVRAAINDLNTALEAYRSERLEAMKPRQSGQKELTETDRKTALSWLKSPDLLDRTKQAIAASGLIGEETNGLIAYLVYTSRKRETPLHLVILSASGMGKTWLQEKVSELIPQEDKLEITALSGNAFYYFGQQELKHKLLLIEDLDGAENALYPIRELQSKRRISKTVTLKDGKGALKTVTLNVEGPVCVSGCTTREQLYEDNANRCILLYMDTSPEQDKRIMDYQRKLSAGLIDQSIERDVREQLKNVQRMLKPITVRNPLATYLQLPESVFKPRRTMLLLLLFTETITFYHQYQRELKTDETTGEQYIESTIEDIEAAFTVLEDTLLKKSDELTGACRNFFEQLKGWLKEQGTECFYSKGVRSTFRITPSSLQRYLSELERMGQVLAISGNRYKGFVYKVAAWDELELLMAGTRQLVENILSQIRAVARNPAVAQQPDGLHNSLKINPKKSVTRGKSKS